MRKYKIDKTWFLALLVVFTFLVVGCDESGKSRTILDPAGTPTPKPTPTPTATPTPTPTPTPPVVFSTNPPISGCGGQGVPINQKIAVAFNQAMDPLTITTTTFTVTGPGLTPVTGTVTYDATNHIAIFAPTGLLPASTTFTGTITTAAQSVGGVPLASNFVWTFVTSAVSDTTAPTVITTNPANLAVSVATNQKITATFSEGMDSTTITGSTFTLTGPGVTPVTGTVTYSTVGTTATFTPTSALAAGVLFTARLQPGPWTSQEIRSPARSPGPSPQVRGRTAPHLQ